jgi:hypothetical protein
MKRSIFVSVVLLFCITICSYSQDVYNNQNDEKIQSTESDGQEKTAQNFSLTDLSFGLSAGVVLFWGDGSDDVLLPFGKYLDSAERNLSLSMFYETRVNHWMGLQTQLLRGNASGIREQWSTGAPANLRFETKFLQFDVQAHIYPFAFFESLSEARVQPFGSLGAGFTAYRSAKYHLITGDLLGFYGYDDEFLNSSGGYMADFVVPFGFGADVHIWKNWSARIQTSFVYVNSDKFDGHVGMGTNINDMYTHTSIGFKYSFGKNDRKDARYKPNLVPVNSQVSERTAIGTNQTTSDAGQIENADVLVDSINEDNAAEFVEIEAPHNEDQKIEGVEFRVQILATRRPWKSTDELANHLKLSGFIVRVEEINKLTVYTAGSFETYREARLLREQLRKTTVHDAFVVGYVDGDRVASLKEIMR